MTRPASDAAHVQQFRKKPVVIEALRWTGENRDEIIAFVGDAARWPDSWPSSIFQIQTLEGAFHVERGSWVIKGVRGEFYAVHPDIFEETYEPVA